MPPQKRDLKLANQNTVAWVQLSLTPTRANLYKGKKATA